MMKSAEDGAKRSSVVNHPRCHGKWSIFSLTGSHTRLQICVRFLRLSGLTAQSIDHSKRLDNRTFDSRTFPNRPNLRRRPLDQGIRVHDAATTNE